MILSGRRLVMARLDAQRSRQMRQSDDRRENSGWTSVMHAFTIASSRPPRGLAMLTGPLGLRGAFAAYNGWALLRPDLSVTSSISCWPRPPGSRGRCHGQASRGHLVVRREAVAAHRP